MEYIDIVDEFNNLTGEVLPRFEVHEKKLFHRHASCWIMNEKGQILMEKRAACKTKNPNIWSKVGGHVETKETPEITIKREVKEEIGIDIPDEQIKVQKVFKGHSKTENYFTYCFIFTVNFKISDYTIQEEEVSEVRYFDIEELLKLKNDPNFTFYKWDENDFLNEMNILKEYRMKVLNKKESKDDNMSKVYFIKEITSENLIKIYESLNVNLKGKVGVKISTGEPGGHNFLDPNLIKDLVKKLNGTIIECCTAYGGMRQDAEEHHKTIEAHGFTKIAPCDIMDEFGEFEIPVTNGFHLDKDIVGEHLKDYDSILMLSHFKGHAMAGFGGALKNMSIGIASTHGKAYIHTAGKTKSEKELWSNLPKQDYFLESMADACKAVMDYVGKENIVYINVANNLSIDCDCASNPHKPEMQDIGIFASIDPVALDQACYDAIINSSDTKKSSLIERMNSRNGIHTVQSANKLNLGSREYELIELS